MQVRYLGRQPYLKIAQAMQAWTAQRSEHTHDELWLVEHDPVYTQGVAGKSEHILQSSTIPVIATNRGGQITYHGPGQVVAYPLVNLRRLHIYVKEYVFRLEASVLAVLEHFGITGHRMTSAPGIYVRYADPYSHATLEPHSQAALNFQGLGKIAALGVKVSQHCTYHGLALNVAMDLSPFDRINPCGYAGLRTIDLASLGVDCTWDEAAHLLSQQLLAKLSPILTR